MQKVREIVIPAREHLALLVNKGQDVGWALPTTKRFQHKPVG